MPYGCIRCGPVGGWWTLTPHSRRTRDSLLRSLRRRFLTAIGAWEACDPKRRSCRQAGHGFRTAAGGFRTWYAALYKDVRGVKKATRQPADRVRSLAPDDRVCWAALRQNRQRNPCQLLRRGWLSNAGTRSGSVAVTCRRPIATLVLWQGFAGLSGPASIKAGI